MDQRIAAHMFYFKFFTQTDTLELAQFGAAQVRLINSLCFVSSYVSSFVLTFLWCRSPPALRTNNVLTRTRARLHTSTRTFMARSAAARPIR